MKAVLMFSPRPGKSCHIHSTIFVNTFVRQKVDPDLEKVFAVGPEPLDELLDVFVRPTMLDVSH